MKISKLRSMVSKEVAQIENTRYRCHEVARVLAEKLLDGGLKTRVVDGLVLYDINELKAKYYPLFGLSFERKSEGAFCAVHSWCEISNGDKTIVIDCNSTLRISENLIFEHYLAVDYKENIPHKYYNRGVQLRKFIIIFTPSLLPSIIRLRI